MKQNAKVRKQVVELNCSIKKKPTELNARLKKSATINKPSINRAL